MLCAPAHAQITPHDYRYLLQPERESLIQSPAGRRRLAPGTYTYWFKLAKGRSVGYRRDGNPGSWWARVRVDQKDIYRKIGLADDVPGIWDAQAYAQAVEEVWSLAADPERLRSRRASPGSRANQLAASPIGAEFTVLRALANYLKNLDGRSSAQYLADQYRIANDHIIPELGARLCDELEVIVLRRWFEGLEVGACQAADSDRVPGDPVFSPDPETEQLLRQRANRILQTLKSALNFAWHDGLTSHERPWARVKPYKRERRPKRRALTIRECQALANVAPPDLRRLILGALHTGCRIGELRTLRVGAFDYGSGTLLVYATKTARARRIVLSYEGIGFFERLTHPLGPDDLIFRKADGQPWQRHAHTMVFRDACLSAGIARSVVFHELRHTYASLLIMSGVSPFVVADQLGHADCRQIIETYGHITGEFAVRQVRALAPAIIVNTSEIDHLAAQHSRKFDLHGRPLSREVSHAFASPLSALAERR